ncbi:AAA family ATPase [Elusimicrobiota bacterium]
MQIICVSRGSFHKGKEFAGIFASKLGYECIGREDLVKEAADAGIPVKRIEDAMFKGVIFSEHWEYEKEHYKALLTTSLCERAYKHNNIVYHGHTGHLLLPGIMHVLRIRVVVDMEYRINVVMNQHNYDRKQAFNYINNIDEERKRWARVFFGVEWDVSSHYDVILNLEQMNPENAASAMCNMAVLPDFQSTPASLRGMEDLHLSNRCRVALARDESTYRSALKVKANNGTVAVTYMPTSAKIASNIPGVLKGIKNVREIVCTMARTNILWIQEKFDPASDYFKSICSVADKWDAAVELLRIKPYDDGAQEAGLNADAKSQIDESDDGGIKDTLAELIRRGRAGGARSVGRRRMEILDAIDRSVPYSLIVVGDVFLSKSHAARLRLARELASFLFDQLKRPVVMAQELASQFLFSSRQWITLAVYLSISAVLYLGVFSHQAQVLGFLQADGIATRIMAVIAVLLFVPLVSYCYGSSARLILKMLRME